jgi:hypothetical protein
MQNNVEGNFRDRFDRICNFAEIAENVEYRRMVMVLFRFLILRDKNG